MLLCDGLGHATFRFTIRYRRCEAPLIVLLCDKLQVAHCSNKIIHSVNNLLKELKKSLRVLTSVTRSHLSQPLWIAARYVVTVKGKKDVGIAWQFPCCSNIVGSYGSGPTSNYTIYLYIVVANEYTTLLLQ